MPDPQEQPPSRPFPSLDRVGTFAAVGPIVFGVVTQALIFVQADFLSQFGNLEDEFPISANSLGPLGLVMIANFVLFGASVIALAYGLRRTARGGRALAVGVGLLFVAGVGLIVEAAPMEFPPPTSWHGWAHFVAFFVWALATLIAYFVLAGGLRSDPRWRSYGPVALGTGLLSVALIFTAPLATTDVVTRHGAWWGPLGRAHFIVLIAWFSLMGWRVRRLALEDARGADGASAARCASEPIAR